MSVDDALAGHFPRYKEPSSEELWSRIPQRFEFGETVTRKVVHREPFGVFIDIGVGFPALIEIVRFHDPETRRYSSVELMPKIGEIIKGRVYAFMDGTRQIAVTQRPLEEWMVDQWNQKWS